MAEFQDVMKQFDRMCNAHAGCIDCPLHRPHDRLYRVSDECTVATFINKPDYIEHIVLEWAEKHPEPVYETWLEFIKRFETGMPKSDKDFIYWMGTTPIPADVAQKLKIKPKEE